MIVRDVESTLPCSGGQGRKGLVGVLDRKSLFTSDSNMPKYIVTIETAQGSFHLERSLPDDRIKLTNKKSEAHRFDSRTEAQHFIDTLPAEMRRFVHVEPAPWAYLEAGLERTARKATKVF